MSPIAFLPDQSLQASLSRDGYAFVQAGAMRRALETFGSLDDWDAFAASWSDLELDTHMADGGRYRRRRHAVFASGPGVEFRREPHQPHFQALDYNPLNGGVARWFAPVTDAAADSRAMRTILEFSRALFAPAGSAMSPAGRSRSISSGSKRGSAPSAGPRRKACTATASTTCWCCSSTGRTSQAARRRFMRWMAANSAASR